MTANGAQDDPQGAPLTRFEDSANPLNTPEDLDQTLGTRIPKEMLPDIDNDIRMKLRPDILRIRGLPAGATNFPISKDQRAGYEVQIIEVGYCADTRYKEKMQAKLSQHAQLVQYLRDAGWRVQDPYIFLFGVAGTIYKKDLTQLQTLGVSSSNAKKTLTKIRINAVQWVDKLVKTRRHFSRNQPTNVGVT